MNNDQLARLARHRKVRQTLDTYASAVATVPAFARLAERFTEQLALLDGAATKKAVTSEGATDAKNMAGADLIARLVKAANALYLLYKNEGNLPEAAKLHRNPTDYRNMGALELATEAADLSSRVSSRAKDLTDYNITAADVKALGSAAAGFDHLLESPQLAIDAAKIKGATARATLSALNRLLKDDFRAGLELLKDTHSDAYTALREATQVDDAAGSRQKPGNAAWTDLAEVRSLGGGAGRSLPLAATAGDVYIIFTLDTYADWDSEVLQSPVPYQSYQGADERVALLGSYQGLVNRARTWSVNVQNTSADQKTAYKGEVVMLQAASPAAALAGRAAAPYHFSLKATLDAATSVALHDTVLFV